MRLNLNKLHITRLPVTLFQAEGYVDFWKNLICLACDNNQLTILNVQGLAALQTLCFFSNPLEDLNLTGVPADIKNKYAELEKSLLFKQLGAAITTEAKEQIIARLGTDYTYENCLHYCPEQADKFFVADTFSQANAYLPAFSSDNSEDIEENNEEFKKNNKRKYKPC